MKSLKGSETLKNLMKSFAGESQARNRYTFFASKAKKEGYLQISAFFTETAQNEKEHAERFYKYILKGMDTIDAIEITADFPVHLGDTLSNLKSAAAGENEEWSALYPAFADKAREEGYPEIAFTYEHILQAEQAHEKRFLTLAQNIEEGKVFKRDQEVQWICSNCGYIHTGNEAPQVCPACEHPQSYYELFCQNY